MSLLESVKKIRTGFLPRPRSCLCICQSRFATQAECQSLVTFQRGRVSLGQLDFFDNVIMALASAVGGAEQAGEGFIDCSAGKFINVSHFISASSLRNLADSFSEENTTFMAVSGLLPLSFSRNYKAEALDMEMSEKTALMGHS